MNPRGVPPLFFVVALLASGCPERGAGPQKRSDAVASSATATAADLFTPSSMGEAMSAIRARVGDAGVLSLELCPERATIQVQEATDRHRVVQYEWKNGRLFGPTPVQLRGKGELESNLFPLSAVDFDTVPALVDSAIERVDAAHGKVDRILVRRNLPADEGIGMRVYVDSPIRDGHVDADARGRITENTKL